MAVALLAFACSDTETGLDASFSTPIGLAVAGTEQARLFVANHGEDSIQVLNLGDNLAQMEFVPGPTQIFPLLIPAGAGPTDLAATPDGRFVVVLDSLTESLRVLDADTLRLVRQGPDPSDAEAPVLEMSLGELGTRPVDMIASPELCAAPCAGWVYLALAGSGVVLGVEVRVDGDVVSLERGRVFNVGGRPSRLAVGPAGRILYATDVEPPEDEGAVGRGTVVRIDVETGAIERRDIGGIGGPLAVSTDGRVLVVGRPRLRDVVLLRDADGPGFAVQDVNSPLAPVPECQRCCAGTDAAVCEDLALDVSTTCDEAHPADRAVCVTASGLASEPGQPYRAAYLGIVPAEIVTLGEGAGHPVLTVDCDDAEGTYSEFAVVAGIDGTVRFLGLVDMDIVGDEPESVEVPVGPVVVSSGWCRPPTLTSVASSESGEDAVPLGSILEPCSALEIPDGRARFACVADGTVDAEIDGSDTAGVVVMPGRTGQARWNFQVRWNLDWEGTLPRLKREPGAGQIDADGRFTDLDAKIDLSDAGIRGREYASSVDTTAWDFDHCAVDDADIVYHGDILQILSDPLVADPGCAAAIQEAIGPGRDPAAVGACHFERRIVEASKDDDGNGVLQFCPPLDSYRDCFRSDGTIDYRVRGGDQFVATSSLDEVERLRPGQRLGPGGHGGHGRRLIFQVADGAVPLNADACTRYDGDGMLITQPCSADGDCATGGSCQDGRCVGERCNEEEGLLCPAFHRCNRAAEDKPEGVCVPVLTRDAPISFRVSDLFSPLQSAHEFDQQGRSRGPAGRLPSAMLVTGSSGQQPAIFVSYSVSDRVLGFVPFDNGGDFPDPALYHLFR